MLVEDALCEEEYEIQPEERGAFGITVFCPACKVQIFGCLTTAIMDDLCTHMRESHRWKSGRA
jgi:hypothetical protein